MSKNDEGKKDKELSLPNNISKEKLRLVQDTYDIYSEDQIEINRRSGSTIPPLDFAATNSKPIVQKLHPETTKPNEPPPAPQSVFTITNAGLSKLQSPNTNQSIIKKIIFDIDSIENLNPELQKNIKKLLGTVTRDEVSKLIDEIEREKDRFLTETNSVLGKMTASEKYDLEKKLAETEVAKEVTEINLSAIISCLNNLVID